jgi:hypothetical protein
MNNSRAAFCVLVFLFLSAMPFSANGQSPQLISYQAILRSTDGTPMKDASVAIKFTIRKTSSSGTDVYTETHSTTTNSFGLVNLNIGSGTTTGSMADIDWSAGPFFLKVDVNGSEMGITQLVSTPYSLYSQKAANGLQGSAPEYYIENTKIGIGTKTPTSRLSVRGSNVLDSAIFEVKNNNGLTVFAVYNEGVRINIDENMKAAKGGFAIGGFSGTKGKVQEYLRVTRDSSRIYVDNAAMAKGTKGGFAIGGFGAVKANAISNFVSLTPTNSLLGFSAGCNITTGTKNFFAGYEAGEANTTGSQNVLIGDMAGFSNNSNTNVFIGTSAGYTNTTGFGSVIIGDNAGYTNNGFRNIFIGREAGYFNSTGNDNVYMGAFAGQKGTDGTYNTFIGTESGQFGTTGSNNSFMGHRAGYVSNGSSNVAIGDLSGSNDNNYLNTPSTFSGSVFLGASSGSMQKSGTGNTYLGAYAGRTNLTGEGNVFIGYSAGQNETGSNKLYISNTSSATPLIYGEFYYGDPAYQKVRINGKLEVAETTAGTGVAAVITPSGQITKQSSSRRYKNDIVDLESNINDFMKLRPVSFEWNNTTSTPGVKDYGLIAEEVNNTFPSLSFRNADGTIEGVNYHAVNILTIDVVQQQQKKIEELESSLEASKSEISLLKEKVNADDQKMQKILDEIEGLKKQVKKQRR